MIIFYYYSVQIYNVYCVSYLSLEPSQNTHFHYKFSHMQIQLLSQIFMRIMTMPKRGKRQTQNQAKEN